MFINIICFIICFYWPWKAPFGEWSIKIFIVIYLFSMIYLFKRTGNWLVKISRGMKRMCKSTKSYISTEGISQHCASLLRTIFASLARAHERLRAQNVRDFPQGKLDSKTNARFLLHEHGNPHFSMCWYKLRKIISKYWLQEKSFTSFNGVSNNSDSSHCGQPDSISHGFIECHHSKEFFR